MAKLVIKNAFVKIGATDYSAYVKSVEISVEADEVDVTTMGDAGWSAILQGIKKAKLTIDFVKDADLSVLDAAMYALFISSDPTTTVEIRQKGSALGADNPKWTGTVSILQWMPIQGAVGSAFGGSVTWPFVGAVTRATS